MSKEPFNIAEQFKNAMQRLDIKKDKVHPSQWQGMERAFYAGASAILMLMSTEIPDLPEEKGVIEFEKLLQEAELYWNNSIGHKLN